MPVSLSSLSNNELPETLRALKDYKKMLKEMGKRATMYFFTDVSKNYRAEYDPTMDMPLVESYVVGAFDTNFGLDLQPSDIRFIPNPLLVSGARIFAGDDMVDVTFKKIKNTLKQL